MANPNHVHDESLHVQHGQPIYVDQDYNALFPSSEQPFAPNAYRPYTQNASPSLPQQSWQPAGVPRSASAMGAPYDASNQFYGRTFSNSPLPYQDGAFRHANVNQYSQQPAVDPSLVSSSMRQPSYEMGLRPVMPNNASPNTIAPQALQNNTISVTPAQSPLPNGQKAPPAKGPPVKPNGQPYGYPQSATHVSVSAPVNPKVVIPKGEEQGRFFVIKFDDLVKATKSTRLHSFVTIGDVPQEHPFNKTTIPNYTPRKSRRELKMLTANGNKFLTKITKKSGKKVSSILRAPRVRAEASSTSSPSGLKREYSDSGSETDSSDDSDYSSDEEDEPSPLPASRPEEPKQAVRYDVIKATWLPSRTDVRAEQIRVALSDFWEVVRTIRDRWRLDRSAVEDATTKKRVNELSLLKSRVESQRAMMEVAIKTTLELGHPEIVHHLSENTPFLLLLYQFLAERIGAKDYNAEVVVDILELLSRCSTLTNTKLEASKLSKVFSILAKPGKGNDKTKELVKKIQSKVVASPEVKAEVKSEAKVGSPVQKPGDSKDNISKSVRPSMETQNVLKRPRLADGAAGEPAKRVASGLGLANRTIATTKSPTNGLKRPGDKTAAIPATAVKPKINPVKPSPSFFSSLQSAPKKPGAQLVNKSGNLAKPAANASTQKKAAPAAPPMRSSAPAFSFAETMANLMKPKEPEVVAKPEEKRPPETAEEKAKRLRKESRRHLRVAFRPDATLTQVRYFSYDPEEEIGHDATMLRDAGDVGGEGRMFKQHKDQMDLDDEDDDLPREESYRDWIEPSLVDWSVIPAEERAKNYTKFCGGMKEPESPEKKANEEHEANTLMVFYANSSDIPPTPRSPLLTAEEPPAKPVIEFGPPPPDVLARAAKFGPPPTQPPVQDLAALFNILAPPQQQQQQQPPVSTSQLESIFAQFANPVQSALAPQQAPQTDLLSILGALQQPQGQPAPAMPQYSTYQAPPPAIPTPDVNALLAALYTQPQPNGTAPPMSFPAYAYPGMPSHPTAPQHQQQPHVGVYENEERKRWRESGGAANAYPPERERERDPPNPPSKKQKNRGGKQPQQHQQQGGKPHKIFPCRFFQEGKCAKGDACTYIHER